MASKFNIMYLHCMSRRVHSIDVHQLTVSQIQVIPMTDYRSNKLHLYNPDSRSLVHWTPIERHLYPTLSFVVPCDFETVTTFLSSTTVSPTLPCLLTSPAVDPPGCQLYPVLSPVVPSDFDSMTTLSPSVVPLLDTCLFVSGEVLWKWLFGWESWSMRAAMACGDRQSSISSIVIYKMSSYIWTVNGKRVDRTAK